MEMVQAARKILLAKGSGPYFLQILSSKTAVLAGRFSAYIFFVIEWKLDIGQRDVNYSSGQVNRNATPTHPQPPPPPPPPPPSLAHRSVTNDRYCYLC